MRVSLSYLDSFIFEPSRKAGNRGVFPAALVRVHGLTSFEGSKINGCEGIVERWDAASCRWVVKISSNGMLKSIRDENLEPSQGAAGSTMDEAGAAIKEGRMPSQAKDSIHHLRPDSYTLDELKLWMNFFGMTTRCTRNFMVKKLNEIDDAVLKPKTFIAGVAKAAHRSPSLKRAASNDAAQGQTMQRKASNNATQGSSPSLKRKASNKAAQGSSPSLKRTASNKAAQGLPAAVIHASHNGNTRSLVSTVSINLDDYDSLTRQRLLDILLEVGCETRSSMSTLTIDFNDHSRITRSRLIDAGLRLAPNSLFFMEMFE